MFKHENLNLEAPLLTIGWETLGQHFGTPNGWYRNSTVLFKRKMPLCVMDYNGYFCLYPVLSGVRFNCSVILSLSKKFF